MASRYCSLFFSLPGLYTNICTEAQSPLSPYSLQTCVATCRWWGTNSQKNQIAPSFTKLGAI